MRSESRSTSFLLLLLMVQLTMIVTFNNLIVHSLTNDDISFLIGISKGLNNTLTNVDILKCTNGQPFYRNDLLRTFNFLDNSINNKDISSIYNAFTLFGYNLRYFSSLLQYCLNNNNYLKIHVTGITLSMNPNLVLDIYRINNLINIKFNNQNLTNLVNNMIIDYKQNLNSDWGLQIGIFISILSNNNNYGNNKRRGMKMESVGKNNYYNEEKKRVMMVGESLGLSSNSFVFSK
ncbi:hypothetical protein ABK040_006038 [Willaertia magna]